LSISCQSGRDVPENGLLQRACMGQNVHVLFASNEPAKDLAQHA
jgi:hypothetical protein